MGLNQCIRHMPAAVQRGAGHRSSGSDSTRHNGNTFRLAGGNHTTPVLSRQLVSPGPLAKPRLNTRSSHSFSSPGSYRYKEDAERQSPRARAVCLLTGDINKKIGIVRVKVVPVTLLSCVAGLSSTRFATESEIPDGHTAAKLSLAETSSPSGMVFVYSRCFGLPLRPVRQPPIHYIIIMIS